MNIVMRILVISHMFPNAMNQVYGIFVANQVQELLNLGHEVKVISPVPWSGKIIKWAGEKWQNYAKIPLEEVRDGVQVFYPRYPVLPRKILYQYIGWSCYWGIRSLVKRIYKRFPFEIIHAHTALPDGFVAGLLKKDFSCPVILTIHGQDIFSNVKMGKACRNAVVQGLEGADRLVAVSTKLKREMASYVDQKKIQVVPNGIFVQGCQDDISDLQALYQEKKIILSVGYLIPRKGHRYVLEALAQLVKEYPQLIYLIVGDGLEDAALRKMVRDYGLDDKVQFLGRKSSKDVMRYMALCDIFVLPSWDEAFGVVYLEAMAQGKPVIGCLGEGIEDIVHPGVNGFLVPPKDGIQLTLTLDYLLRNEMVCTQVGQEAQKTVEERFTWFQVARELERIYYSSCLSPFKNLHIR